MNSILVHSCFNALEPFTIGMGTEKIFHFNPNASCKCSLRITARERDARLAQGAVYVLARRNVNDRVVPEWTEVVEARKTHGPPWVQLVTASRMERAYAFEGKQYEVDRIEVYGELGQLVFVEIGALMRKRGAVSPALPELLLQPQMNFFGEALSEVDSAYGERLRIGFEMLNSASSSESVGTSASA